MNPSECMQCELEGTIECNSCKGCVRTPFQDACVLLAALILLPMAVYFYIIGTCIELIDQGR
jgi:hypothetical protein